MCLVKLSTSNICDRRLKAPSTFKGLKINKAHTSLIENSIVSWVPPIRLIYQAWVDLRKEKKRERGS
jgi:hypothetical protein